MKKIISLLLSVSLLFSSMAPAYAQVLENPVGAVSRDIDPVGSYRTSWSDIMQQYEEQLASAEALKQELEDFVNSLPQGEPSEAQADQEKAFKEAYLAELEANKKALEEEFGKPLPKEILTELDQLKKQEAIAKAWEEQKKILKKELAEIGGKIFMLYDIPGEKRAALKYMYTIFPVIAEELEPEDKARGLKIMRELVLTNAEYCQAASTWTGFKAFLGADADLTDAQTRCEQAFAAAQLLPVLGDFTKSDSEDVKAVNTLFAQGFNGIFSVMIIKVIGGMLLEAGHTASLKSVFLAAMGDEGASFGLFFADYTPDITSGVRYLTRGSGFSNGYDYSYYGSPVHSNQRNAWADLGRAWVESGKGRNDLQKVLAAAIKSSNPNDVKFKPFVTGALVGGYIHKDKSFTQELAKNLFFMDKGDLNPYTSTYIENLLAVAYHKAGGIDEGYNTLREKYNQFPPLNEQNHWTCPKSTDITGYVPSEELPARVICQWSSVSAAKLFAEALANLFESLAMVLDCVLLCLCGGRLLQVAAKLGYKGLALAGKVCGQGMKWARNALKLYAKMRRAWRATKLYKGLTAVETAVNKQVAIGLMKLEWRLVKPTKKLLKIIKNPQRYKRAKKIAFAPRRVERIAGSGAVWRAVPNMSDRVASFRTFVGSELNKSNKELGKLVRREMTDNNIKDLFGHDDVWRRTASWSDAELGQAVRDVLNRYDALLKTPDWKKGIAHLRLNVDGPNKRLILNMERHINDLDNIPLSGLTSASRPVEDLTKVQGYSFRLDIRTESSLKSQFPSSDWIITGADPNFTITHKTNSFTLKTDIGTGTSGKTPYLFHGSGDMSYMNNITQMAPRNLQINLTNGKVLRDTDAQRFITDTKTVTTETFLSLGSSADPKELVKELQVLGKGNPEDLQKLVASLFDTGDEVVVFRTLRFTDHEAASAAYGYKHLGNMHIHVEFYSPAKGRVDSIVIPVKGTKAQADGLLDYYKNSQQLAKWAGVQRNVFNVGDVASSWHQSNILSSTIIEMVSDGVAIAWCPVLGVNTAKNVFPLSQPEGIVVGKEGGAVKKEIQPSNEQDDGSSERAFVDEMLQVEVFEDL